MEKFDLTVIGGGPGGYPAAIRAAQLGASVALVEKEALGGTCLNWGCIPTKTLIASSDLYARIQHASELGITVNGAKVDYSAMNDRKDDVVAKLQGGIGKLLKAHKVTVFNGLAAFQSRNRIKVTGDQDEIIETKHTIIATGSEAVVPGFLPKSDKVLTSKEFLALKTLPASIIVMGGGVIGCEFACMAAQLGAEVTVVELLEDILLVLDSDIRRELKRHMEKRLGIRTLTGKPLEEIKADTQGVSARAGEEALKAEMLLSAIGRRPNTDGLSLESAGLGVTDVGAIEVDEYCRTEVSTIYAVGDVTAGSTQLAHAATAQGTTAAENICGEKRQKADKTVPACIFTAPEIGSVGLTEQQAAEQGIEVAKGKFIFGALGKAMAANESAGFAKWIASTETGQLLGAHAVGAHATELVSEATVAIQAELTVEDFGKTIHCHPTFSEAWMEAAHALHGTCVHQPPSRRR